MRRILSFWFSLLALGCGGMPGEYDGDLDSIELGHLEQALTVPGQYGVKSNNARCTGPNTGCKIPKTKTVKYHNLTGTGNCTGTHAQVMKDAAAAGINYWKGILQNRGWTVTVDTNGGQGPGAHEDVFVQCTNDPAVIIGGTTTNEVSSSGYQLMYSATVWMNRDDINALLSTTSDPTRRKWFTESIVKHELGHAAGLGHSTQTECQNVSNAVMCSGAAMTDDPSTWGVRNLSNTEKGWLQNYQP